MTYGSLDGLVNNAGTNVAKHALDYTEAELDELYELNLRALYLLSMEAARRMIAAGTPGVIVNVTSQAGVVGAPMRSPYSALKAGVNNLSRSLAAEWAEHGIRVNAVAPTVTDTELTRVNFERHPELRSNVTEKILLGHRPATVDEIALPVIFALSPAAAMITGHTLVVDGGWTIV